MAVSPLAPRPDVAGERVTASAVTAPRPAAQWALTPTGVGDDPIPPLPAQWPKPTTRTSPAPVVHNRPPQTPLSPKIPKPEGARLAATRSVDGTAGRPPASAGPDCGALEAR